MAEQWDIAVATFLSQDGDERSWIMVSPLGSRVVPNVQHGLQLMGGHGWELVSVTVSAFDTLRFDERDHLRPQQYDAFFKKRKVTDE